VSRFDTPRRFIVKQPSTPKPPSPEERAMKVLAKLGVNGFYFERVLIIAREIRSAVSADRRGRKGK